MSMEPYSDLTKCFHLGPALQAWRPVVYQLNMVIYYSRDDKGNILSLDNLYYRPSANIQKKIKTKKYDLDKMQFDDISTAVSSNLLTNSPFNHLNFAVKKRSTMSNY